MSPKDARRKWKNFPRPSAQAIRIVNPKPGALAGKINRKTFPNLDQILIIYQGSGAVGMHDVRFEDQPDKADYDFQNLTPGEYTLTVQLEARRGKGGANWPVVAESRRVTVAAGKTTTLDLGFDIDPKAAAAPAAPPVAPNAPAGPPKPIDEPADEKLAIAGRVVDNQGKPVADALVSLPVGCAQGLGTIHLLQMRTSATGQFSLELTRGWLTPEEIRFITPTVWAYAPGHALAMLPLDQVLGERPPHAIELVLGPASETALHIVDPDGKPVAGAEVRPNSFGIAERAYAGAPDEIAEALRGTGDAEGIVRLPAVDLGKLTAFQIKAPGFGEQSARYLSPKNPAVTKTTTIPLRPAGRLELRVTSPSGDHVAGLRVRIETFDEQHKPGNLDWEKNIEITGDAGGVTGEKGEFVAAEIAAGIARVDVSSDPALSLRLKLPEDVHVTAGQTTKVEIPLVPAQRVRGRSADQARRQTGGRRAGRGESHIS